MDNPNNSGSLQNSAVSDLPKLEDVIEDIARVCDEQGLSPVDITVSQYSKFGGKYDGRKLRRMGGFASIVDAAFRQDKGLDIYTSRALARKRSYVARLERKLTDAELDRREFIDGMERVLKEFGPVQISKLPLDKPLVPAVKAKERENVVVISDTHMGLVIDREEILSNGYNWTVAARRMGKLAQQVAEYKFDHRDECPTLRVCIGGDIGQGIIHLNDSGTDLITMQTYGITTTLIQMIDYWRNFYKKIVVETTPDNHMRLVHKDGDRARSQKYDSHSTMGFILGLQAAFMNVPDVEFHVPKTAITTFNVLGHKFGLTHGDTHINSGNVGKQVNVTNVANQILRLNAAVQDGKHYDAVILGHVHVPLFMHLNETNTKLVINGTGSGTDGYAESLGFFRTKPTQIIFEATKDYPVGDLRIVDLDDADDNQKFEKIIKPYNRELELVRFFKDAPKHKGA